MTDYTLVPLFGLAWLLVLSFTDDLHLLSQDIGLIFFHAGCVGGMGLATIREHWGIFYEIELLNFLA